MTKPQAVRAAFTHTCSTPDGDFTLIVDHLGAVLASGWTDDAQQLSLRIHPSIRPVDLTESTGQAGPVAEAAQAVSAYYAGDTGAVAAIPVRQHGTELQQRGWAALREIAAGSPLNYSEFAAVVGNPSAVRAAAAICARNAAGLFTPCHRVLRTDGSLGGFAWGTAVKQSLLDREEAYLRS